MREPVRQTQPRLNSRARTLDLWFRQEETPRNDSLETLSAHLPAPSISMFYLHQLVSFTFLRAKMVVGGNWVRANALHPQRSPRAGERGRQGRQRSRGASITKRNSPERPAWEWLCIWSPRPHPFLHFSLCSQQLLSSNLFFFSSLSWRGEVKECFLWGFSHIVFIDISEIFCWKTLFGHASS